MAVVRRVPLRKYKEDIRYWTHEGRSDEWIARTLGTSVSSVQSFRSRNGIYRTASSSLADYEPLEFRAYEGTLEEMPTGWATWFDPAVQDDPVYRRAWSGAERVEVIVTPGKIILSRPRAR